MFASFNISFFSVLVGLSLVLSLISQLNLTRLMTFGMQHPYAAIAFTVIVGLGITGLWIWAGVINPTETIAAFVVVAICEVIINHVRRDAVLSALHAATTNA